MTQPQRQLSLIIIDPDIMKQCLTVSSVCSLKAPFLSVLNHRLLHVISVSAVSPPALPVCLRVHWMVSRTDSLCPILMKSCWVLQTLCCSSASTSLAPWASPHRWERHHPQWFVYCKCCVPAWAYKIQLMVFISDHFCCAQVSAGEQVFHRSRLHVSVFHFPSLFHLLKTGNKSC